MTTEEFAALFPGITFSIRYLKEADGETVAGWHVMHKDVTFHEATLSDCYESILRAEVSCAEQVVERLRERLLAREQAVRDIKRRLGV